MNSRKECSRCFFDSTIPAISFADDGTCSYCAMHDEMDAKYPVGVEGRKTLKKMAKEIAEKGKGKEADVIVGVSGGLDSSYLLHLAVQLGLRPIAVHYDNGWNYPVAKENMHKVTRALNVPLIIRKVDQKESDAMTFAFLHSGVPDLEAPTDLGLATVLYSEAASRNINYIFNGHNFRTEGVAPLGWSYMDARYIADVCAKHGGPKRFETYPLLTLAKFLAFASFGIRRIRPLYWEDIDLPEKRKMLQKSYGWNWYGGHHRENLLTDFFVSVYLPRRWNRDLRKMRCSALARTGKFPKEEFAKILASPQFMVSHRLEFFLERMGITHFQLSNLLDAEPRLTHRDYKTYKRHFELLRPYFGLLLKMERVPESFYKKYCFPG